MNPRFTVRRRTEDVTAVRVERTQASLDALEDLCVEIEERADGRKMVRELFVDVFFGEDLPDTIDRDAGHIGAVYVDYVYDNSWVEARGNDVDPEWDQWVPVKPGDWVVRRGRNEFEVLTPEAFDKRYQVVSAGGSDE